MTEQEWLTSTDPVAMLDFLNTPGSCNGRLWSEWKPSDRKLRLVACACCRRVQHLLNSASLEWLEKAEAAADTGEKLDDQEPPTGTTSSAMHAAGDADGVARAMIWLASWGRIEAAVRILLSEASRGNRRRLSLEQTAHILRDIVGNPFRPVTLPVGEKCGECRGFGSRLYITGRTKDLSYMGPVITAPSGVFAGENRKCDTCQGTGHEPSPVLTPLVQSLAEAAYQERDPSGTLDPDRLAVLSDALIDAGLEGPVCDFCKGRGNFQTSNSYAECPWCGFQGVGTGRQPHPMLAHLRLPGPHYRGCWAIDLLTGRGVSRGTG